MILGDFARALFSAATWLIFSETPIDPEGHVRDRTVSPKIFEWIDFISFDSFLEVKQVFNGLFISTV